MLNARLRVTRHTVAANIAADTAVNTITIRRAR
jgi:hypothetical protein